jgi:hypothetical protein
MTFQWPIHVSTFVAARKFTLSSLPPIFRSTIWKRVECAKNSSDAENFVLIILPFNCYKMQEDNINLKNKMFINNTYAY